MDRQNAIERRESGYPGGGAGRRDEVGGSGVYPASAPNIPPHAVVRTPAAWGQGDRVAAGYEDAGSSEPSGFDMEWQDGAAPPARRRAWPVEVSNDPARRLN